MKNKENAINAIKEQGMLPLFFHQDLTITLRTLRTIYSAGVRVFEYTNRGKEALSNFKELKNTLKTEMPDLFLGIGTIKNTVEAEEFLSAGADFIVCPVADVQVGELVHGADKLWIPGCMTPTEINIAYQHEAGIVKLFPANTLGTIYLKSVKELFPGQLFVPTGGVNVDEQTIGDWFKAGVCAVGMGSSMINKKDMDAGDFDKIFELTKQAFDIIKRVRQ